MECCNTGKISAKETLKGIFFGGQEWAAEKHLVYSTAVLTCILLILSIGLRLTVWRGISGFENAYMLLLFLLGISVAVMVGSAYHFRAYKKEISCSIGMMEGMSFGMMGGFMIGAIIGATSGMYWGSVIGLLVGSAMGVWAGRCCGVMGILEGGMGGVMGGTMGAMLSVMLLADPLPIFLALLIGSCALIMIGIAYMRVYEHGKIEKAEHVESLTSIASTGVIIFLALAFFAVMGLKSGPVWLG